VPRIDDEAPTQVVPARGVAADQAPTIFIAERLTEQIGAKL